MRYFGYGSNLDRVDLERWCAEHDMVLGRYAPVGVAFLPDHALTFHYRSGARGGGALDVTPAFGHAAPGALIDVDEATEAVLARKEGDGIRYERRELSVLRANGEVERAFTYTVMAHYREARFVVPTEAYVAIVRRGLAELGIPAVALEAAALDRSAPFPESVFVYGTLKRGHCRESLLGATTHEPATIRGELLDLGAYPGLRVGHGVVHGELHRLAGVPELLERLDPVEDFEGWDKLERSMYHRAIVRAETATGPEWAWTYVYRGTEPRPHIADGVWRGE